MKQEASSRANQLLAFPMHGHRKLRSEGFRTRDGHLLEWFGERLGPGAVTVVSRPEPEVLRLVPRLGGPSAAYSRLRHHYVWSDARSIQVPSVIDRQKWWVKSLGDYAILPQTTVAPAIIWNPMVALSNLAGDIFRRDRVVVAELLDDWSIHHAFRNVRRDVVEAYRVLLREATHVSANSEGTLQLARRHGRDDALLLPNGVDPERFHTQSTATGPTRVGYVGKIGRRLDADLISSAAKLLPGVEFVLAGPVLDREYRKLGSPANVTMLGDVPYESVPRLLQTFDVGWVPHSVGKGEVGGDAIKIYEYRAAGLPVLTTPIIGAGSRGLAEVHVRDSHEHIEWLRSVAGGRIPRKPQRIPAAHTWSHKADTILSLLGLAAVRRPLL